MLILRQDLKYWLQDYFLITCMESPDAESVNDRDCEQSVDWSHQRSEAGDKSERGEVDEHQEASLVEVTIQESSG